jgi:hypothetical protein
MAGRFWIGLAVVLSLALVRCGDDSGDRVPEGPLAETLGEIGGGGAGTLGVGWAEPERAAQSGVGARLIAAALGPNADTVVEESPLLRHRFGFDPLSARRLVSVGGSYAFGLRLDGVDAPGLRDALIRVGGRPVQNRDGLELVDVGDYAVVPQPLLRADVNGLGARDAFGPDLTVLAISDTSRDSLLGGGDRLIDESTYRAAADCLGDVVVARIVPERHLLSTEQGFDLVAVGVRREREVICVLGGTADRARSIADGLEASLAPGAREPRTGEPIGDLIEAAEVGSSTYEDVEAVSAELTPAPGAQGFVFATIARGSLVELINGPR